LVGEVNCMVSEESEGDEAAAETKAQDEAWCRQERDRYEEIMTALMPDGYDQDAAFTAIVEAWWRDYQSTDPVARARARVGLAD